ncbi:hypothetical protein T492DRAFT_916701 [Pavlovales sp. CCMP2436]|nr:hypothetical protein T492DRAFT_916701 [Pavlovales sp. CCMP2436]
MRTVWGRSSPARSSPPSPPHTPQGGTTSTPAREGDEGGRAAALRADFLVMQRRKQEVVRTQMERHVKADWVVGAYADWESRTDAKLKTRAVQLRYDSIRAQDKAAVIARRNRLAQMLMAEEAHFQRQIDALDESPDQRRVRMETRARELRGKRENERKTYVDEQLERQWRMGCDALRNADSVNIAKKAR